MELIDEYGRVAGRVNIIDLLVVLGTTAVVVAGLALLDVTPLLTGGVLVFAAIWVAVLATMDSPESSTRYVTLDLGTVRPPVARSLENPNTTLDVVSSFVGPAADGIEAVIEVAIEQRPYEAAPSYRGRTIEVGDELTLEIAGKAVEATVEEITDEPSLATERQELLVETELDAESARELDTDTEYTVAGRPVATVETVTRYGTGDADRVDVLLGLAVDTRAGEDPSTFGGTPLRTGRMITIRPGNDEFETEIARVDALAERGEPVTRVVTARANDVPPEWEDAIEAGLEERICGETNARIEAVSPATGRASAEVSTDGGTDLRLTVELQARELDDRLRFKRQSIELGSEITLSLGTVTLTPTIVGIE